MNLTEQFEDRLARKTLFNQKSWLGHLKYSNMSKELMDKLILDFLIKEGHKQAAKDFASESGLKFDPEKHQNMT
jgi:hypothetical protein